MPYTGVHSARQRDPKLFISIAKLWENKGIYALGGRLKSNPDGGSEIQTIRFESVRYSPAQAKKWLESHGYKFGNFENALPEKIRKADKLKFSLAKYDGNFNYGYGNDMPMLRQYAKSFDNTFQGGLFIIPIPYGLRGLLTGGYGDNGEMSRFDFNGEWYDVPIMLGDGTVIEVVVADANRTQQTMADTQRQIIAELNTTRERGEEPGPVNLAWFVTDVLAVEGVDVSKQALTQRLAKLSEGGTDGLLLRAFMIKPDEDEEFVAQVDRSLSEPGIMSVVVKGATNTYQDSQFAFTTFVPADLRLYRNGGRVEGRPEIYGKRDLPWKVVGVPSDFPNGQIAQVRVFGDKQASFIGPTSAEIATTQETIRTRMRRAGLRIGPGENAFPALTESVRVSI